MVVQSLDSNQVDRMFQALADATRRDIVTRVLLHECSVSHLAASYSMSFAAVQKHVAVLERADIVTKARRGREQHVRANIDAVRHAARVLDHFEDLWRGRIDRFGDLLDESETDRRKRSRK